MSVIAESPKKRERKQAAEPAISPWCGRIARATHALLRAKDYFTPPPINTPLEELFSARDLLLDPEGLERQRMDALLFGQAFGDKKIDLDPVSTALDRLAGQMASPASVDSAFGSTAGDRRLYVAETTEGVLRDVDAAITNALYAGQRDPRIIYVQTDKLFAVSGHEFGVQHELSACYADDLPAGTAFESFMVGQNRPAAILSPMMSNLVGRSTHRLWVLTSTARWWTAKMSILQKQKRRQSAQTFSEYLELQRDGLDPREPLAVREPELPSADAVLDEMQLPATWLARLALALDCGQRPFNYLKSPGEGENLGSLLEARQLLGVRDNELNAVHFAADRFAAVAAGSSRYADLRDWLRTIVAHVNPKVQRATSAGIRWAALQAGKGTEHG